MNQAVKILFLGLTIPVFAGLLTGCRNQIMNVSVSIEAPETAQVNEPFFIIVTIANNTRKLQQLKCLEFATFGLEGIAVERTEPPELERKQDPGGNQMRLLYNLQLAASQNTKISLLARGLKTGKFYLPIGLCINSEQNVMSYPLEITVN